MAHKLNGISYVNACQQFKQSPRSTWQLTSWIGFHRRACQQFRQNSRGAQKLTFWMGFHMGLSAIQIKPRRCTATHKLDGISYKGISEIQIEPRRCTTTHTLDGMSYRAMLVIQIEPRRCLTTHKLDVILQRHVSKSNVAQEVYRNSLARWDLMRACQQFKQSLGDAQPLTRWMGFYRSMLAIQRELRMCT